MRSPSSPGVRRFFALLGANVAGLVAIALALEGGTRILGLHFPGLRQTDAALWTYDATKGWFHAPHSSGRVYMGGPDSGDVRINGLGLRGPEIERRKPPGVPRVLVFGDSFVFGIGVDEDHDFTSRLQARLAETSPRGCEVVNMGVSGYSTDQELLLFQELGAELAPDLVILVATDNDFAGNGADFAYGRYYKPFFELRPDGAPWLRNTPVPRLSRFQSAKLWLGQHSNLWNAARTRRSPNAAAQRLIAQLDVGQARPARADPIRLMAALVTAFDQAATAAGARFVMFNTGHRGERTGLFQLLRPYLTQAGIAQLGLEGFLGRERRRHPDLKWDFPDDTHWNVESHRLAADVVATHLRKEGFWP